MDYKKKMVVCEYARKYIAYVLIAINELKRSKAVNDATYFSCAYMHTRVEVYVCTHNDRQGIYNNNNNINIALDERNIGACA